MVKPKRIGTYGTRRGSLSPELPPNSYLIRKPIQKGVRLPKTDVPEIHHGQHIYLYNNIQTNQVVYSLTRHLNVRISIFTASFRSKYHSRTKTPSINYPT